MPAEVVYRQVYRLLASASSNQATGHWRAISPSVTRSMTVTSGTLSAQVRAVRSLDRSDSQADSAGSIPVTRSRNPSSAGVPDAALAPAPALLISTGH